MELLATYSYLDYPTELDFELTGIVYTYYNQPSQWIEEQSSVAIFKFSNVNKYKRVAKPPTVVILKD